jgi:hypothetical protein
MAEKKSCKYCGGEVNGNAEMCVCCSEKLRLIRKMRAIIFSIMRGEEENNANDKGRNESEVQTIQRAAS